MKHKRAILIPAALIALVGVGIIFELRGFSVGTILSWAVLGGIAVFALGAFVFWAYCTWYVFSFLVKLNRPQTTKRAKEVIDSVSIRR